MDGTNLRNSFKKDSRSLETFGDALIQTKSVKILRKSFSKKKKIEIFRGENSMKKMI